jgi:predicted transcriptional regulator
MATTTKRSNKPEDAAKSIRTSISLPRDLHATLTYLAKGKKVSVAWVIRDAAEQYVDNQGPLLQREIK